MAKAKRCPNRANRFCKGVWTASSSLQKDGNLPKLCGHTDGDHDPSGSAVSHDGAFVRHVQTVTDRKVLQLQDWQCVFRQAPTPQSKPPRLL